MKYIIYLVTLLICEIKCNIMIHLEMDYFLNPNGVKFDNKLCRLGKDNKCLTSFRFCITSIEQNNECLSEFETQIIGENSINNEQFKLTTESIQFPLRSLQIENKLILIIEVLNNDIESSSQTNIHKSSKNLISRWTFNLFDKLMLKKKWTNFFEVNSELNQKISFNYKFECALNYIGYLCEKPICLSGCSIDKGGYCKKPNECLCKEGWTGEYCNKAIEINNKKCDLDCKNGGACVTENDVKICKCDNNIYKGQFCEIRIVQACNNSTVESCLNGGSCLANGECLCPPGYAGKRCQTKKLSSQCGMVTCYNGGTCYIDNQNEYVCACHSAFTGRVCDIKIVSSKMASLTSKIKISETKENNQLNFLPSTKSESTINVIKGLKNIDNTIQKSNTNDVSKFTSQEIVIILLLGIGMPVFLILIAFILYCRCNLNKMSGDFIIAEELTKIDKTDKSFESNLNKEKDSNFIQKNSQLDLQTNNLKIIKNNIFDKEFAELNEKKICIKTISSICQNEKQINDLSNSQKFKLVENNIYSIYNYDQSILNLKNQEHYNVNCKNILKGIQSNTKFDCNKCKSNIIATIV